MLDNETSQELKNAMIKYKTDYQLVPPHTHRANSTERAIQTFKSHFIAGLCSLDPNFPINEWDRLLHQAFLTLNLLRTARANPALSAYAYLFGNFDFNSTPLAPSGTKAMVHIKTNVRGTWESRAKEGWYIGPAMKHYRCVKCFLPATRREVDADTVTFIPKYIKFPEVHLKDFLRQAATDILTLLRKPPPSTVPSLEAGDDVHNALLQIASLLNRDNNSIATIKNLNKEFNKDLQTFIQQKITSNVLALQQKISNALQDPISLTHPSNLQPIMPSIAKYPPALTQSLYPMNTPNMRHKQHLDTSYSRVPSSIPSMYPTKPPNTSYADKLPPAPSMVPTKKPNFPYAAKIPPTPSLMPTKKPNVDAYSHPPPIVHNQSFPHQTTILPFARNPHWHAADITLAQLARVLNERIKNKASSSSASVRPRQIHNQL